MYHMATLPNGKPIDMDMLETAMEDSDLANKYFLHLVTGKVLFFSEDVGFSNEDEQLLTEIDESDDYVAVERIPSHEAYQWMIDFVDEIATPKDVILTRYRGVVECGKAGLEKGDHDAKTTTKFYG